MTITQLLRELTAFESYRNYSIACEWGYTLTLRGKRNDSAYNRKAAELVRKLRELGHEVKTTQGVLAILNER
jgi:hypothetical protein